MKIYTDKVLDHFRNPRNQREMEDYDAIGRAGSAECGDYMFVYIKVKEKGNLKIIDDISFETFGCAAVIASFSILIEMAKGKSLEEAEKLTKMETVEALGGLPELKIHCSVMAADGSKEAIKVYRVKKKK